MPNEIEVFVFIYYEILTNQKLDKKHFFTTVYFGFTNQPIKTNFIDRVARRENAVFQYDLSFTKSTNSQEQMQQGKHATTKALQDPTIYCRQLPTCRVFFLLLFDPVHCVISYTAPSISQVLFLKAVFCRQTAEPYTVEHVFSGHTVLSGHLRILNFHLYQGSPVLSARDHPILSPNGLFVLSSTCVERSLKADHLNKTKNNLSSNF